MKFLLPATLIILFSFSIQAQYEYSHEDTYEIAQDGLLTLNTEDADVTISGTSRTDAYVKVYKKVIGKQKTNRKFDIEYVEEDGNLTIKEKRNESGKSYSVSWNTKTVYNVELGLPDGVSLDMKGEDDSYTITNINGSIKIKSEDGDISITDSNPESLKIKLEDGDVALNNLETDFDIILEDGSIVSDNCNFGNLKIDLEDGDIQLKNVSLASTDINIEDGDIYIDVNCDSRTKVNINTEDGDINLKTAGEGASISVSYEDGDVDYDSDNFKLIDKTKRSKKLKTRDQGEASFVISVEDGDVSLSHN